MAISEIGNIKERSWGWGSDEFYIEQFAMPAYYSVAGSVCQPGENMDVETG